MNNANEEFISSLKKEENIEHVISALLSEADFRNKLRDVLLEHPGFLTEVLASVSDKKQLQRLVGNPNRLLPIEPDYQRPPSPFNMSFANAGLKYLMEHYDFQTVLDVGAGAGKHARAFQEFGKTVTKLDFGVSIYAKQAESDGMRSIVADANTVELDEEFDCVWASHVLEHQPNVNDFLKKLRSWTKPEGIIAISVPPAKFNLVGGHLTMWTPGHLIYNLVFAGIDCSDAKIFHYGYNITAIVKNRQVDLPTLDYDNGDLNKLRPFMPKDLKIKEGIDGFSVAKRL